MNHFNQLTPAEAERLAMLAEECGEVIQVVGKILRHGYESTHPEGGPTNRQTLEHELGDIKACISRLSEQDIDKQQVLWHQFQKLSNQQYLHHQEESNETT